MGISKKVRVFVMGSGQRSVEAVLGIALALFLLFYKLGSLVPNISPGEAATRLSVSNLESVLMNPLFAPYKLVQLLLVELGFNSVFALRAISASIGLLAILTVYYVLQRWYTTRISIIGTLLFATSGWFLVHARQATPDICYALIVLLLAYGTWMRRTKRAGLALFLGALLSVFLVYIPGLIWLVILGVIWQRREISHLVKDAPRLALLAGVLFLVLLTPLVLANINDTSLIKPLAGLSATTDLTPLGFAKNIGEQLTIIFWQGPKLASQGLVGSPLLDPFVIAMALLGCYAYVYQRTLDRSKMLGGGLLAGLLLLGLGGLVSNVILMPLIYIIALAGVALMVQQWFTVFPRNPLARSVGVVVITVAVLLTSFYQLDRYFQAWPASKQTKQLFSININA